MLCVQTTEDCASCTKKHKRSSNIKDKEMQESSSKELRSESVRSQPSSSSPVLSANKEDKICSKLSQGVSSFM